MRDTTTTGFNPSYGLHALRAYRTTCRRGVTCPRFNPSYGLHALRALRLIVLILYLLLFQSLIWVACPTGRGCVAVGSQLVEVSIPHMGCMPYGRAVDTPHYTSIGVSIPHMGCMPYGRRAELRSAGICSGFNPSYGLHALRAGGRRLAIGRRLMFQSLIWVACPTGLLVQSDDPAASGFNPSYGLHALRACTTCSFRDHCTVSIPHMGCMPYGRGDAQRAFVEILVSIPHMGCMPYGPARLIEHLFQRRWFQSLIWVACPTGGREGATG